MKRSFIDRTESKETNIEVRGDRGEHDALNKIVKKRKSRFGNGKSGKNVEPSSEVTVIAGDDIQGLPLDGFFGSRSYWVENDDYLTGKYLNALECIANVIQKNFINSVCFMYSMDKSNRLVISFHFAKMQFRDEYVESVRVLTLECFPSGSKKWQKMIDKHVIGLIKMFVGGVVVDTTELVTRTSLSDEKFWLNILNRGFFVRKCEGFDKSLTDKCLEDVRILLDESEEMKYLQGDLKLDVFQGGKNDLFEKVGSVNVSIRKDCVCCISSIDCQELVVLEENGKIRCRCNHCEIMRKGFGKARVVIDPELKKRLECNKEMKENYKVLSRECMRFNYPIVRSLMKCVESGKFSTDSFLYDFLYVQLKILNRSCPQGVRWTGNRKFEKVFRFFTEMYTYTQEKGYSVLVGEKQWEKIDGINRFTGIFAGPSTKTIKSVQKIFSYPPGPQEKPVFLFGRVLQKLGVKGKVRVSLSADEIHLKKGLVRTTKGRKTIWKGMFVFDKEWVLRDMVDDEEGSESVDDIDPEIICDGEDSENITVDLMRSKLKREVEEIKRNDGKLATRILQFMARCSVFDLNDDLVNVRMPIYYFPSVGVTHAFAKSVIVTTIESFNDYFEEKHAEFGLDEVVVDSLCFDGDKGVEKFIKSDGIKNEDGTKPFSFMVKGKVIVFIPDFGHLLKCIRRELLHCDKHMFFPVESEGDRIGLGLVNRYDLWRLFYWESKSGCPSYSGISLLHLNATGVMSMKSKLSSDFFKNRVIKALSIALPDRNIGGTMGFIKFFKECASVFKTRNFLKPIRQQDDLVTVVGEKIDWRLTKVQELLAFLKDWKKLIEKAYEAKKINAPSSSFLSSENETKVEQCLRGLHELHKTRKIIGAPVIPDEIASTNDIENTFNLHRHFSGYGQDGTTDLVKYEKNTCKVLINRMNKVIGKGSSYKYVADEKGFDIFDGNTMKVLKSIDKKSNESAIVRNESLDNSCDNFKCFVPAIKNKGWWPKSEDEWRIIKEYIGAGFHGFKGECKRKGEKGEIFLEVVEKLLMKDGNRKLYIVKDDQINRYFAIVMKNYYENSLYEHNRAVLECFEDNFVPFVDDVLKPDRKTLVHHVQELVLNSNLHNEMIDAMIINITSRIIRAAHRRLMSSRSLFPEKGKKAMRTDFQIKKKGV